MVRGVASEIIAWLSHLPVLGAWADALVHFMYQPAWAQGTGHRAPRLNMILSASPRVFPQAVDIGVRGLLFPVWVGLVQSGEGLKRAKRWKTDSLSVPDCGAGASHLSSSCPRPGVYSAGSGSPASGAHCATYPACLSWVSSPRGQTVGLLRSRP